MHRPEIPACRLHGQIGLFNQCICFEPVRLRLTQSELHLRQSTDQYGAVTWLRPTNVSYINILNHGLQLSIAFQCHSTCLQAYRSSFLTPVYLVCDIVMIHLHLTCSLTHYSPSRSSHCILIQFNSIIDHLEYKRTTSFRGIFL